MNSPSTFEASFEVLRNNQKVTELHVSFRITYEFTLTGLTEAEESRSEDLDFEEKTHCL